MGQRKFWDAILETADKTLHYCGNELISEVEMVTERKLLTAFTSHSQKESMHNLGKMLDLP